MNKKHTHTLSKHTKSILFAWIIRAWNGFIASSKILDSDVMCVSAKIHTHEHTHLYLFCKQSKCEWVNKSEKKKKNRNRIWRLYSMYSIETCHQLQNADRLLRYFFSSIYIHTWHNMCGVFECVFVQIIISSEFQTHWTLLLILLRYYVIDGNVERILCHMCVCLT